MVTKVLSDGSGNKRKDQLVVNGQTGLDVNRILQLQDDLPDVTKHPKGGPGIYRFEVTDQGTTQKDVWQIRLGQPGEDGMNPQMISRPGGVTQPMPMFVPVRGPAVATGQPPIPAAPESESLGNGFVYNSKYRLLTVPDGRVFQWEPGRPLPDFSVSTMGSMPSAPFGTPMFSPAGSTTSPELAEMRARTEALVAELAKTREENRERERQAEIATLRKAQEEQIQGLTTKFEQMVERLAAPKEDPRVATLERQLAEQTRESALRNEMNTRLEQITALVRENAANRADPTISVLKDMMLSQAESARENLRLIREVSGSQLTAAQASALTPERLLTMLQQQADMVQKSGSGALNEKFMGTVNSLLDSVLRFRQAEASLGGGNGPDWMSIIQTLTEKAGTAVSTLAQAQSKKAVAETAKANAAAVQARRDLAVVEFQKARVTSASPAALAAAEPSPPPTGEAARDALAASMFKRPAEAAAPAPSAPPAAPTLAVVPPTPAAASEPPARRRGRRQDNPLARATIDEIRHAFNAKSDDEFFGPFLDAVKELRATLPGDEETEALTPDEAAQYVLDARPHIAEAIEQNEGKPPLVVDMLAHGRFDYLFERLLPEANAEFWMQAATALQAKLAAERATAE
jgi:hypothetical protein